MYNFTNAVTNARLNHFIAQQGRNALAAARFNSHSRWVHATEWHTQARLTCNSQGRQHRPWVFICTDQYWWLQNCHFEPANTSSNEVPLPEHDWKPQTKGTEQWTPSIPLYFQAQFLTQTHLNAFSQDRGNQFFSCINKFKNNSRRCHPSQWTACCFWSAPFGAWINTSSKKANYDLTRI